jgi:hypothetical protein
MPKTVFKTVDEYKAKYFPKCILNDLEEKLCSELGLTQKHQHRLDKNENDSYLGLIEVAKPFMFFGSVQNIVSDFYKNRGFEISNKNGNFLDVKKGKEAYSIIVSEHETNYSIWVSKSIFS